MSERLDQLDFLPRLSILVAEVSDRPTYSIEAILSEWGFPALVIEEGAQTLGRRTSIPLLKPLDPALEEHFLVAQCRIPVILLLYTSQVLNEPTIPVGLRRVYQRLEPLNALGDKLDTCQDLRHLVLRLLFSSPFLINDGFFDLEQAI